MHRRAVRPADCRAMDATGFAEFVEQSEPVIRRLLGRLCGGHSDIDDLTQETYLRAWRGLGRFRGQSSLQTWITRIAVNVSHSWRQSRRASLPLSDARASALRSEPEINETALRQAYQQALASLSPEQRAVFVLHEVDGLTYQQMADALHCPVGTVMSRLHRARAGLLEAISERIEEFLP
jgi:RNA polymerase sigma-70 factor (ECF subfamily)